MVYKGYMIGRNFLLCFVTALVFGGLVADASATEKLVLRTGPDYADSDCLGDMSKPACVGETWLACLFGDRSEFCHLLGPWKPGRSFPDLPRSYVDYQVVAVKPVLPNLIADILEEPFDHWKDVTEVRIIYRPCDEARDCSNYSIVRHAFYLKREGDEWRVFRWAVEPWTGACEFLDDASTDLTMSMCRRYIDTYPMPWVHEDHSSAWR